MTETQVETMTDEELGELLAAIATIGVGQLKKIKRALKARETALKVERNERKVAVPSRRSGSRAHGGKVRRGR